MKIKDQMKMIFDEYPGGAVALVIVGAFIGALINGAVLTI